MTPDEFRELCTSSLRTPLALAEELSGLSEADRKTLSKTAQEVFRDVRKAERDNWGFQNHNGAMARLGILACCPWSQARRVNTGGRSVIPAQSSWTQAACRILADRRPEWAGEWVALQLDADSPWQAPLGWDDVRGLIETGVIDRPTTDGYVRLLAMSYREFDPARDADILEADVWRLFEVDTFAFDYFPEPKKVDRGKWQRGELPTQPGYLHDVYDGWPRRLYQLAHQGTIDRNRLIDAVLASFWHDFRGPMRTGLLRFLEVVEPTDVEIAARQQSYCELLRNGQGPVVGMALKALARVEKSNQLDAAGFLAAVPGAFAIASKSQPKSALTLISRVVKSAPEHLPIAVDAIGPALNHDAAEIQEQAVDLLAKWKDEQPTLQLDSILEQATLLADHHRQRLQSLVGEEAGTDRPDEPTSPAADFEARRNSIRERLSALPAWVRDVTCLHGIEDALEKAKLPPVFDPDPVKCPALSACEPITPIRDVDELIDAVAHLFEVIDDAAEIERIVDGILRLGGETTADFDDKTQAIRHPAFGAEWVGQTVPGTVMWCVPSVLRLIAGWLQTQFNDPWFSQRHNDLPAVAAFDQRVALLIARFRKGAFGPVLSTPTHRGGWIDPRVFVARLNELAGADQLPNRFDFIGGLLRLAPDFRDDALASADSLPAPWGRIVRYALGGDERPQPEDTDRAEEWLAAGRARHPRGDLEEFRLLGLSSGEPDGVTAAKFTFNPDIDLQALKDSRWLMGHSIRCVSVTPDKVVFGGGLTTRPTVALAARLTESRTVSFHPDWLHGLSASLWPLNPDATLATACHQLMLRIDDKGSMFEPVTSLLAPLQAADLGWSDIARVALWLGLLSRDDQARGIAIDVLIEGIADGRAHTDPLGDTLLHIASGGWIKLNRLADGLREVARTSILAERVAAEIIDRLIASWDSLPRDGHHLLTLQLELLRNLQGGPSEKAQSVLASVKGSGKAAKLSKQLSELQADSDSPTMRAAALEAVEGRITRAERIARFMERDSVVPES